MKPSEIKIGKIYRMRAPGENEYIDIEDMCVVFSADDSCSVKVLPADGRIASCSVSHFCIDRLARRDEVKKLKKKALKAAKAGSMPKELKKKVRKEIKLYFNLLHVPK